MVDNKIQSRFFSIMACYLDDERLAAHAITHFLKINITPGDVYNNLMSNEIEMWVIHLEKIAEDTTWRDLKEWCLQKQSELDIFGSNEWSCGDIAMIEKAGWKFIKSKKDDYNECIDDNI